MHLIDDLDRSDDRLRFGFFLVRVGAFLHLFDECLERSSEYCEDTIGDRDLGVKTVFFTDPLENRCGRKDDAVVPDFELVDSSDELVLIAFVWSVFITHSPESESIGCPFDEVDVERCGAKRLGR